MEPTRGRFKVDAFPRNKRRTKKRKRKNQRGVKNKKRIFLGRAPSPAVFTALALSGAPAALALP